MPPKSPKLYDVKKTTMWFAVISILLFVCLIWMIAQDSTREWKDTQRKFMEYSKAMAEGELETLEHAKDKGKLADLEAEIAASEEAIEGERAKVTELEKALAGQDLEILKATSFYQELKQFQDSDKYFYEELHHIGKEEHAAERKQQMKARAPKIQKAKGVLEGVQKTRDETQASLDAILSARTNLKKELAKLLRDSEQLAKKIDKLTPNWISGILNAPMLDFINPTLQIQQIVLDDLYDDFYFRNHGVAKSQTRLSN